MSLPLGIPVDPDRPTARRLLEEELAKQEYQQAKPTWWDDLVSRFLDWISHLQVGNAQGPPAFGLLVAIVAVVVILVIALLVFGLPRINRRSRVTGALFGEDDARTSAQMRSSAEDAARKGDFTTAVAEMFRSIARGLAERTVLSTSPGTTAHDFAGRAGETFPAHATDLATAATAFDAVRYLGREGTALQYELVDRLERQLRSAKPSLLEAVGS